MPRTSVTSFASSSTSSAMRRARNGSPGIRTSSAKSLGWAEICGVGMTVRPSLFLDEVTSSVGPPAGEYRRFDEDDEVVEQNRNPGDEHDDGPGLAVQGIGVGHVDLAAEPLEAEQPLVQHRPDQRARYRDLQRREEVRQGGRQRYHPHR